jgi:hypothetical protein
MDLLRLFCVIDLFLHVLQSEAGGAGPGLTRGFRTNAGASSTDPAATASPVPQR